MKRITGFLSMLAIAIASFANEVIPRVVNYTLVNAETNQDVFDFSAPADQNDVVVLDLTGLAHPERINIRVNTEPPVVGTVVLWVDANFDAPRIERSAPYTLFGDNNGDYKAWEEVMMEGYLGGSCWADRNYHDCLVELYTDENNPDPAYSTYFRFRLKYDGIRVTGFTLVNAVTDQDITDIHEGDVIDLSTLPTNKLNIRANTEPPIVGSVFFGGIVENTAPYAEYGDRNGNYHSWIYQPGTYHLEATPYSRPQRLPIEYNYTRGVCGIPLSVSFQFIQRAANKTSVEINDIDVLPSFELFPNPNQGVFNLAFSVGEVSNVKVEIFDMFGKSVFREELPSFSGTYQRQLDLSVYPQGVYLLRVDDGEATRVKKVVISER